MKKVSLPPAKDTILILFFGYIAYLCVVFQEREHFMLDYNITFDYWWYFYQRLREGGLAQWNPYSLLGRLNVQWNYIPVSIFSPFLLLHELTPESFHTYQILSTFTGILGVYLVGRLSGYGRFLPLLPMMLIFSSGYKYWASFLHFATLLFCFPLAMVCLLKAFDAEDRAQDARRTYLGFIGFFSLALTGCRMEKMVYAIGFVLLIFFFRNLSQFKDWKSFIRSIGKCAVVIALPVAGAAWQLAFLIHATTQNHRIRAITGISVLGDSLFWRYVGATLLHQPVLLMIGINLVLVWGLRRFFARAIQIQPHFLAIGILLQLALLKFLIGLKAKARIAYISHVAGMDLIFTFYGLTVVVLLLVYYFICENRRDSVRCASFLAVLFGGFYIADYSWIRWPLHSSNHYFFWQPAIAALIPLGAVSLWLKRKTWMVAVLATYHLVGETGAFFLFEIFGLPWLVPRAAIMEIPFQVIVLLEAIVFIKILVIRCGTWLLKSQSPALIETRLKQAVQVLAFLLVLFNFKSYFLPKPVQEQVADATGLVAGVEYYPAEFPFAKHPIGRPRVTEGIQTAYAISKKIKSQYGKSGDPFRRLPFDDSILKWEEKAMHYRFLPAYSQTLNTAPMYSSEIPRFAKYIFSDFPGRNPTSGYMPHPEMTWFFQAYKFKQLGPNIYPNDLLILPHTNHDPVLREIMAEPVSKTPRAFLTTHAVIFQHHYDEYNFLRSTLARGGSLAAQITTSDENFSVDNWETPPDPKEYLVYDLDFIRNDPENVVLYFASNRRAYLALLDLWDKGWKAYVDGVETTVFRGYMGTRFIKVPQGNHLVDFRYRVPNLIFFSLISAVAWVAFFTAVTLNRRRPNPQR